MIRQKHIIPTAVAFITATAVGAFADQAPRAEAVKTTESDTIRITNLAVGETLAFPIPATPDSLVASRNPFAKDKLLDALTPISPLKASSAIADFKNFKANDQNSSDRQLELRRFVTRIRPDAFFKGDLTVTTPAMMKAYLDGKEFMEKSQEDSIAKPTSGRLTVEPDRDVLLEFHLLSSGGVDAPEISIVADKDSRAVNIAQGPELDTRYNIYTVVDGERISDVSISPDGNYLMLRTTFCENGVNTDNHVSVTDRRTGKTIAEDLSADAEWIQSKDATLLFSESSRKMGNSLVELEIPSMKRRVKASGLPEDVVGGMLAPDGSYMIYYTKVDGKKDEGIMRRLQSPDDRQPSNRTSRYLSIYRFAEKAQQPITSGGPSTYLLDIAPDSKKILYSSTRETPEQFPFYEATLVELDLATLHTDTIRGIDSSITDAIYSPDGKSLMIAAGPNAFNGIGLNAGNFTWGNDFDIQLYMARIGKGELADIRPMTRNFDPAVESGMKWNPTDGNLYFMATKGYDRKLYRMNPKTDEIIELPTEVDYVSTWTVSRNRPEFAAYTGMGYNYIGKAYNLNTRSGKSALIADPNLAYTSNLKAGESEMWSFTCPAEAYTKPDSIAQLPTTVECTMTLPPDFDPSKKYPMIVYYYSGTVPTTHTSHSPYTPNLFASRGYVVLTLNPSGTTGYGQEFSARHVNAWGDRTADEIIYGVGKFCDEHPYIDRKKIGCIGASYGGFMTDLLQTKTDIFAAAVSHAGISNITSYWGEGFWGYSYNSVAAARSYPWNNPTLFTENSPLFAADKIHTPLLLLHGNRDTNVPIGESIQLYNALKLLGREVEFITVDGSDHVVYDFQQRKEWHATIMAWFERWLKDDPRWWNSIYK